jgi:hypothetical protein
LLSAPYAIYEIFEPATSSSWVISSARRATVVRALLFSVASATGPARFRPCPGPRKRTPGPVVW